MRLLGFLVKLFVSREISRFSHSVSSFTKPLGFLMFNGRPFNEKRDFSVFSWNLSFLVKPFVFRRNLSFLAKLLVFPETFRFSKSPFGFIPWLMAGHPLLINSKDHSSKLLTLFLRENPKIPERKNQELAGFLKPKIQKEKERSREKRKENSSLFDFRSKPGNLKCWDPYRNQSPTTRAPTRTPSGEIGPEDSWPRVLKGSDNRLPKNRSSK